MKSLIRLVQSIQLYLYKSSKQYKKRDLPVDISQILSEASKILICLPIGVAEAEAALRVVPRIKTIFRHWDITIFVEQNNAPAETDMSTYAVQTYSANDLSKFSKPKKFLLQKLQSGSAYDLAIDLSIPFHFTNLVMTWICGTHLRVGFYHPERDDLYNFMLRHKADATLENSYQSLINYLQSFK